MTRDCAPAARWIGCWLLGIAFGLSIGTAQSDPLLSAAIAPQPLAAALADFAHQAGLQLVYVSEIAAGRPSKGAPAGLSATEALTQLLDGTGLRFEFLNARTVRIYESGAVAPASQSSETIVPKPHAGPPAHRLDTLDEILVTGTRRGEHLSDFEDVQNIPASVSLVTGLSLEAENAVQLSDYSAYVPGVNVIAGGMPGASGVAIRGVVPLNTATPVTFYLDNVPIGASAHYGYAGSTALDLLPYDLERIEIQRGPQGTFGGAGAEIGSIKYVLNPPNVSSFEARIGADVSAIHAASEPGESVRAMVNAPIVDDLLAVRATSFYSYTPGYIDNVYSGATDINVLREYGGRIAALWRASESLSMTLSAFYYRTEQDSQTEVLSPNIINVPNTGDAYIVSGVGSHGDLADSLAFLAPYKKSLDSYSATVRWNSGFADLMSVTGWSRNHEHYEGDQSLDTGPSYSLSTGTTLPVDLSQYAQDVYLDKFSEEMRIISRPGNRIDWLLGGFYTHERVSNQSVQYAFNNVYQPIVAFTPNLAYATLPSTFSELAMFGDLTWTLSDKVDLAAGIRVSHDTQENIRNAGQGLISTLYTSGQSADTVTTWMATARYRILPRVMIYGRVATGSQPSSPTASLPGATATEEAALEKGEMATNYEIGVKSEFLDRHALIDLTLYYLNRDRILVTVSGAGFLNGTPNAGAATAQGLELTSSYSPLEGLTLAYNAAYTQAAYSSVVSAAQYQLTGFQLKNIPKWDMSITANYDWALPNSWRAHLGAGFRSVGEEWASDVQSRSLGGYPTAALPSYTVLDFNAAISRRPLSLKFFARNLTDKRADLDNNVIEDYTNTPVRIEHYILQPRTLGFGFDYVF